MIIEVTKGKKVTATIVIADSIRELSAYRYLLFNQAWAREASVGADMYAQDGHLAKLGMFLTPDAMPSARIEHAHLVMSFTNLTSKVPVSYLAATLATLTVSINGKACTETTEAGLKATAEAILATELTQYQLVEAVEQSKKNFTPS